MKLRYFQEIVGTLKEIQDKNDKLHLTLVFKKELEIPKDALPREKLEKCIDKNIGIIFTGEKYIMRNIFAKIGKKD